ncbi:MAG TPA: ATP-binding protein [Polyangiaceae bacterium]|nr:ATP-binding protein [Polyangiaceae bacterium]
MPRTSALTARAGAEPGVRWFRRPGRRSQGCWVIQLRFPGLLPYRDVALRVVSASCKVAGKLGGAGALRPSKDFADQVVSACGEALNNIFIHGYRDLPPGEVVVEIEFEPKRLVLRILDDGRSFDPTLIPPPDLDGLPESGMGLFIIRSFMDVVSYEPGRPNTLLLAKSF